MSFYVSTPGGYPTGPVSCDEDEGCVPLLANSAAPPVIVFASLLGACCLLIIAAFAAHALALKKLSWSQDGTVLGEADGAPRTPPRQPNIDRDEGLERTLLVGRARGTQGGTPQGKRPQTERPHRDSIVELDGTVHGNLRRFEGFRGSLAGSCGMASVVRTNAIFSLNFLLKMLI